MDFDWDISNVEHIARHKVEPDEAQEVFDDPAARPLPSVHRGPQGQVRYGVVGETEASRLLVVIYEVRGEHVRVVTARPATPTERHYYHYS